MLATRLGTKTRKYSLCVVDDDLHELNRFKIAFEDHFYVGIGTDLRKAEADLRAASPRRRFNFWRRKVNLYVLDMYFPTGTTNTPEQRAKLAKAWGNCCNANRQLKTVLAELHQTFDGGRELAAEVERRGFFRKPAFVFSREREISRMVFWHMSKLSPWRSSRSLTHGTKPRCRKKQRTMPYLKPRHHREKTSKRD